MLTPTTPDPAGLFGLFNPPPGCGPRRAIDIDGCQANLYEGVICAARRLGVDDHELPASWQLVKSYATPFESFYAVYNHVHTDLQFWTALQPIEKPLSRPTCYLTNRPPLPGMITATSIWNQLHGIPPAPIVLADGALGKAVAAQRFGIDEVIDDSPENFEVLRDLGVNCKLLNRPWNAHVKAGEHRIYTLSAL